MRRLSLLPLLLLFLSTFLPALAFAAAQHPSLASLFPSYHRSSSHSPRLHRLVRQPRSSHFEAPHRDEGEVMKAGEVKRQLRGATGEGHAVDVGERGIVLMDGAEGGGRDFFSSTTAAGTMAGSSSSSSSTQTQRMEMSTSSGTRAEPKGQATATSRTSSEAERSRPSSASPSPSTISSASSFASASLSTTKTESGAAVATSSTLSAASTRNGLNSSSSDPPHPLSDSTSLASLTPSTTPPSASNPSPSSTASASAEAASSTPSAFVLPGRSLSVLPIGLGVFGGIAAVGLIVVALVTYERRRYRAQFRTRRRAQEQQQQQQLEQVVAGTAEYGAAFVSTAPAFGGRRGARDGTV